MEELTRSEIIEIIKYTGRKNLTKKELIDFIKSNSDHKNLDRMKKSALIVIYENIKYKNLNYKRVGNYGFETQEENEDAHELFKFI